MDQNPIHSSDLNYGVPQLFMDMLDEILEGTQSQDFDDLFRVLMETNNKNIAELGTLHFLHITASSGKCCHLNNYPPFWNSPPSLI